MGKSVTPRQPCLICGKPDWCLVVDGKNGPLHMCKRMREKEVISGGHTYIMVRETDECGVYEEKEQNLQAKKAWIEEKKASDTDRGSGGGPGDRLCERLGGEADQQPCPRHGRNHRGTG